MNAGTLYIVATPIGNLGDITLRALEVLRAVDYVYAEDTRVVSKLLSRYQISKPLRSYREAAAPVQLQAAIRGVIALLEEGKSVAYVSDAGTPGISDPGQVLVKEAVVKGLKVEGIPGASALSTIVSISGQVIFRPLFVGFLPKKKGHQTLMAKLREGLMVDTYDALVFYESPERIVKLLQELIGWEMPLWGCLARELTKLHEEVLRGPIKEIYAELAGRATIRGEITLLISRQEQ